MTPILLQNKMLYKIKVAEHSFDTCVSIYYFSKTLDSLVAKNGNTQMVIFVFSAWDWN